MALPPATGGLPAWQRHAFGAALATSTLFVLFTGAAMLAYPGGTYADPTSPGFSFTDNFFSDLGRTRTRLGGDQALSRVLFTTALLAVAGGLAAFFAAFAALALRAGAWRVPAFGGSLAGAGAALCFAGIALVPADVDLPLHDRLVQWAFRLFLAAVLCHAAALAPVRGPARSLAGGFVAFALLLGAYLLLITFGPSPHVAAGQAIQATGQKIVVYGSIACVGFQSLRARGVAR